MPKPKPVMVSTPPVANVRSVGKRVIAIKKDGSQEIIKRRRWMQAILHALEDADTIRLEDHSTSDVLGIVVHYKRVGDQFIVDHTSKVKSSKPKPIR